MTTEIKNTPWRVAYDGHPEIKDSAGRLIASVEPLGDDGNPTFAETELHANLFAAAPTQHNALVKLLKMFDDDMHDRYAGTGLIDDKLAGADFARDAIKAATP